MRRPTSRASARSARPRPTARIRVDANQGWTPEQAIAAIRAMEDAGLGIEFVEQPVERYDIDGLATVTEAVDTPVMADESVFGPRELRAVIIRRAADLVNVKLAKCGGLGVARLLLEDARDAGMGTIVGSMMEGPIGVGAAAALVAAVGTTHVSDLDAAWWASESPVVGGASYDAGVIVLPDAPGLGIGALRGSQLHLRDRSMTDVRRVGVPVSTMWVAPDAPRDLDAPAVADRPDDAAWLAGLSPDDRLGLHGRTLTQLLDGEPVIVGDERGGWSEVIAPWQPVPGQDGYQGWVRTAHLRTATDVDPDHPHAHVPADRIAVAAYAERFLGLVYLWGGTSPAGFDCSGLVHYSYRQSGVVVPRDSPDQALAVTPVPLGTEEPGDLYFFARDDGRVYHVGFVAARGRMLHAPEAAGSGRIVDEPLDDERRGHLVAAGRFAISPVSDDE